MKQLAAVIVLSMIAMTSYGNEAMDVESKKIDYLIASIASLENAQFIRNGKAYNAMAAADHLRLKRRKAGARVETVEDFIKYCAKGSSMSGKPYQIRFADGRVMPTEEYLRQKLAEFKGSDP